MLCSLGIPRFLFLLPALRAYDDNEPYCTKHLNISVDVRGGKGNKTVEMRYAFLLQWFSDNYLQYFSPNCVLLDFSKRKKYIQLMTGLTYKDNERVHIKLPYNVKDYDSLLKGTLILPSIWEYQGDAQKREEPGIQLLGHSSFDKWIKTSSLV